MDFLLIRSWSILLTCIIFLGCEAWDLVEYGIWWCIMTFHQFHPLFFGVFWSALPVETLKHSLLGKSSKTLHEKIHTVMLRGHWYLWNRNLFSVEVSSSPENLKCFSVGIGRSHLYHGGHKSGELIPIKQGELFPGYPFTFGHLEGPHFTPSFIAGSRVYPPCIYISWIKIIYPKSWKDPPSGRTVSIDFP